MLTAAQPARCWPRCSLHLPARAQGTKMTIATGVDPVFSAFYVGRRGAAASRSTGWT